jgi:hypothetical protein
LDERAQLAQQVAAKQQFFSDIDQVVETASHIRTIVRRRPTYAFRKMRKSGRGKPQEARASVA